MIDSVARAAVLVGAGLVGGLVGTAGGITSLVSYPSLLAVGVAPLAANIANLVAVVGCWPGAAVASRRELAGHGRELRPWLAISAAGAAAGSLLLLTTSEAAFARVVPFLVLGSGIALVAQPHVAARQRDDTVGMRLRQRAGLVAIGVYNGYFGAGSGVMTLVLLLYTTDESLPTANAVKNMLVGAAAVVSAVVFAVVAKVDWAAAVPLSVGMFGGRSSVHA